MALRYRMKTVLKLIALLILASVPMYFAAAKPEEAPGIQKKTLQIFNVSVDTTSTTATISWETNCPSMGSVLIEDYIILDDKHNTHHSVTIPFTAGWEYHVEIRAFSEAFGSAGPVEVIFTL